MAKSAEHKYKNNEGNPVHFQFIGVVDLIYLHEKFYPEEVWYEWKQILTPMERKHKLIPREKDLSAFRNGY